MFDFRKIISNAERYKYPALVLIIGIALMLVPSNGKTQSIATDDDSRLQQILSCTEGVGESRVLISENGVVIVCKGAGNASVRLNIVKAVGAYTGFNSDKITILKMTD